MKQLNIISAMNIRSNMKKIYLISGLLFLIASTSMAQQKKADTLRLEDKSSMTFAILPDVQNYIKYDYNQGALDIMMGWIVENRNDLNIKAVLCTGDLVDQNECQVPPFPRFGNLPSDEQWEAVSRSFGRLDNKLPYIISPGNHDYGYTRSETPDSNYPTYFKASRNLRNKETLVSTTFNRLGKMTLENSAYEFHDEVWGDILIITTEYAPRKEVLDWAHELCISDRFKNHLAFFMTHSYLLAGDNAEYVQAEKYKMIENQENGGQFIWDNLIKITPNIRFVLCGHIASPSKDMRTGNGFRVSKNDAGKEVTQMMFNMQGIDGAMSGNGGDGWLRLLEFKPDGKTVKVHTYSPLFGFSDLTKQFAREKSPCNDFSFTIKK